MGASRAAPQGIVQTVHRAVEHITKMNRCTLSDSNLSLDARGPIGESSPMIAQPYHLYVERIEPEKNMARFYALAVQPTLFGEVSLVRRWGRIGARGRQKVHLFGDEKQAVDLFLELLREKRNRGYRPKPAVEIPAVRHSSMQRVDDKALAS